MQQGLNAATPQSQPSKLPQATPVHRTCCSLPLTIHLIGSTVGNPKLWKGLEGEALESLKMVSWRSVKNILNIPQLSLCSIPKTQTYPSVAHQIQAGSPYCRLLMLVDFLGILQMDGLILPDLSQ